MYISNVYVYTYTIIYIYIHMYTCPLGHKRVPHMAGFHFGPSWDLGFFLLSVLVGVFCELRA